MDGQAKMRCVPRNVGWDSRGDEIRPFFQKKLSNAVIGWMDVRGGGDIDGVPRLLDFNNFIT